MKTKVIIASLLFWIIPIAISVLLIFKAIGLGRSITGRYAYVKELVYIDSLSIRYTNEDNSSLEYEYFFNNNEDLVFYNEPHGRINNKRHSHLIDYKEKNNNKVYVWWHPELRDYYAYPDEESFDVSEIKADLLKTLSWVLAICGAFLFFLWCLR